MIEIKIAKDGNRTLLKDGTALLSLYKPADDVEKYLKRQQFSSGNFFAVFGGALGYTIKGLLDRGVNESDIAVYEPEDELLEEIEGEYPDVQIIRKKQSLSHWMEQKTLEKKKPCLLALESFKKAYADAFRDFEALFYQDYRNALENLKVSSYFSKVWFTNFIRNMVNGVKRPDTFVFNPLCHSVNYPVLIASAGPSLNQALPEIKKMQDRFIILSVLSAARTLVDAGIKPDFIIISDAGAANSLHGQGIPRDITIFASVYSSSSYLSSIQNPVLFYDLMEELDKPSYQLKYPSVSIDAGIIANCMTKGGLVFCGFDLCYTLAAGSHSSGNAFSGRWNAGMNRLKPPMNVLSDFLKRKDIQEIDHSGKFTHPQFRIVQGIAENFFQGSAYYGEGVPFQSLKKLGLLEDAAGGEQKQEALQKLKKEFLIISHILPQITITLEKIWESLEQKDPELMNKLFVRELLTGTDLSGPVRLLAQKASRIYQILSTVVPW